MHYPYRLYPYRQSDVRAAAHHGLTWLQARNGGRLPETFKEAWKLAIRCGLSCRHLSDAVSRDGELARDRDGNWTIYYHARLSERRRVLVILHELIEWLCITESPELMLDLPGGGVFCYDGGDNPADVRHRAAKAGEAMYLKLMKK